MALPRADRSGMPGEKAPLLFPAGISNKRS
jgi:hypothetical protein